VAVAIVVVVVGGTVVVVVIATVVVGTTVDGTGMVVVDFCPRAADAIAECRPAA
jgi:hypothetical protein